MKIVILGLASDDIDSELRALQVLFGDAIAAALNRDSVSANVETLFFTPVVTRPGIGPFPDKIAYLRNEPAVNAAVNLSYQQWKEGSQIEHVNLLADALIRTIHQIKNTKMSPQTKADLCRVVEGVRKSLSSETST
jgi:hypothetical protein